VPFMKKVFETSEKIVRIYGGALALFFRTPVLWIFPALSGLLYPASVLVDRMLPNESRPETVFWLYSFRGFGFGSFYAPLGFFVSRLYIALSSMDYAGAFTARMPYLSAIPIAVIILCALAVFFYEVRRIEHSGAKLALFAAAAGFTGLWFYTQRFYPYSFSASPGEPEWLGYWRLNLSFFLGAPIDALAAAILFSIILAVIIRNPPAAGRPFDGFKSRFTSSLGRVLLYYLLINSMVIILFSTSLFVGSVLGEMYGSRLVRLTHPYYFYTFFQFLQIPLYLAAFFLYFIPYIIVAERTSLRNAFRTLIRFWRGHPGKILTFFLFSFALIFIVNALIPAALIPVRGHSAHTYMAILEFFTGLVSVIIMTAALKFYISFRVPGPAEDEHLEI